MSVTDVDIVVGRAKTGKTYELLTRIAENERRGEKSMLIVPSTYTFEIERQLAKCCGGGYMNTKVCGFHNFSQMILAEAGLANAFITQQGRQMVVRRSIELSELGVFAKVADKPGFAGVCDAIISNFISCELTPDDIMTAAENVSKGSVLYEKLVDLSKIYSLTDQYLTETGQPLKAATDTICETIPISGLCNSHIYIDGIENPSVQTFRMLEAMLKVAKSLTIAIKCDFSDGSTAFARANAIYGRIKALLTANGIRCNVIRKERMNRYDEPVLEHIERELFSFPAEKCNEDSSKITFALAKDERQEVMALVAAVLDKAKSGVRYRNMAIVAPDRSKYDVLINRMFKKAGIPLFCDTCLKLAGTNAARLINCALNCIGNNYRLNDVVALMKTGLAGVSQDEAELLENYMLAYNIMGTDLKKSLSIGTIPQTADDTRERVIKPLMRLQEGMAYASIAKKTDALLEYLNELQVKEQLEAITARLEQENKLVLARQYAQVWRLIEECLFQLKNVMGDSRMNIERYAAVVAEGLTGDIIGVIPAGVDMVSYSGLMSALPFDIEYLFVLGAAQGQLPPERKDEDIVDDKELSQLENTGMKVWQSVEIKREQDSANIYTLLTSPTKGMYISYAVGKDGKPAYIITRLAKMLNREFTAVEDLNFAYFDTNRLAVDLRWLADGGELQQSSKNYIAWRMDNDGDKGFNRLCNAIRFSPALAPLDRQIAEKLFDSNSLVSATRLEQFNRCSFSQFMQFGLLARERREYKEKTVDIGSACHQLLDEFVKHIIDNRLPYNSIDDKACSDIIDMLVPKVLDNYNNGMWDKNPRYRAKKRYIIKMAKDTASAIMRHMRCGSFSFMGSEVTFGSKAEDSFPPIVITLDDGRKLQLSGKIDRVDSYKRADGSETLRIIDYKKGGREFSYSKLYAGLELQLPLYLSAVAAAGDMGCGMFYMPVRTNRLKSTEYKADLMESIIACFRMSGAALSDLEIVEAMDSTEGNTIYAEGSSLLSKAQLDMVTEFAQLKAKTTAEAIKAGEIMPKPFRFGKKTACRGCKYATICLFDEEFEGCSYNEVQEIEESLITGE